MISIPNIDSHKPWVDILSTLMLKLEMVLFVMASTRASFMSFGVGNPLDGDIDAEVFSFTSESTMTDPLLNISLFVTEYQLVLYNYWKEQRILT